MKVKCFFTLLFTVIGFISANKQPNTLNSFINSIKSTNGNVWAVLVATGNKFWDHRFQSAILHVYHLLVAKSVKKNQIITMLDDNVIHSKENPNPGKVYSVINGKEIYSGVTIDYTGKEVSAINFENILKSNSKSKKKVLNSTKNDGVIIYYAGHGTQRMLVFPRNSIMLDEKLVNIVEFMTQKKTYKKMMFVVDSSKSGSVFLNFSQFTDVLVQTATDAVTDIHVAFYNSSMGAYMISVFSLKWLMLSDNNHSYLTKNNIQLIWEILKYIPSTKEENVQLSSATHWYIDYKTPNNLALFDLVKKEEQSRNILLKRIISYIDSNPNFLRKVEYHNIQAVNTICFKSAVETFLQKCHRNVFVYEHATLSQMYKFANLCQLNGHLKVIKRAITEECKKPL